MKVYIERLVSPDHLQLRVQEALKWIGADKIIRNDSQVFLKPNLTWRLPMPGVTTTPEFIEAAVAVLREYTSRIIIGEADSGYHLFPAEEAFQSHGLYDLVRRYGIKVVNLSKCQAIEQTVIIGNKPVAIELPEMLLSAVDIFVTLPVPKVHAMTGVSLGFKNQWGCQPSTMRLRNHPDFNRKILAINKLLNPRIVLFDGKYFLDGSGPMIGEAVRMDLLIASDDIGAGSMTCCEIMGIDPRGISHLRLAQQEGMMVHSLNEVVLNQSLKPFKVRQFKLRRSLINYVALIAFHSHFWTRLFYDSIAAAPVHWVLYKIRKNRMIGRLLYGRIGPPEGEGRG